MKKNFDEDNLELVQPRRYQVYKKLLESFKKNRQSAAIDYSDPRFKNPDGSINSEAVKKYTDELAEKELAEHAYVLSEFMAAKDIKYEFSVPIAAVSRRYVSSSDYVYSPGVLQINVSAIMGEDETEALGDSMLYDGYRLKVKHGDIEDDITLKVDFGVAIYPLNGISNQLESIAIRLYKPGKWETKLVQEVAITFVDVPYIAISNIDVDRGQWVAGASYFAGDFNPETNSKERSHVWYFGCKFKCLVTGTQSPPRWNSPDWEFEEGDPHFRVSLQGGLPYVNPYDFKIKLKVIGEKYCQDVTEDILPKDVVWTRYTEDYEGNVRTDSDLIWSKRRGKSGMNIELTNADLDSGSLGVPKVCIFSATVMLRDGEQRTTSLII